MNWNTVENKKFIRAILALASEKEARAFLRDLLTENEIEEFATRLQAAEMLAQHISYKEIEEKTGFSSTTVARVSKWLNNGMNGYKIILKKLHHRNPTLFRRGLS